MNFRAIGFEPAGECDLSYRKLGGVAEMPPPRGLVGGGQWRIKPNFSGKVFRVGTLVLASTIFHEARRMAYAAANAINKPISFIMEERL